VTKRYWGSYYVFPADYDGSREESHQQVLETYHYGPSHLAVALELWTIAGQPERAREIRTFVDGVLARASCAMAASEMATLIALLDPDELSSTLARTVLEDGLVPTRRLEELRRVTTLLAIDETRGELAGYGVAEAEARVYGLVEFLESARVRGLVVALD
jgi:hypothetical protein